MKRLLIYWRYLRLRKHYSPAIARRKAEAGRKPPRRKP